MSVEIPLTRGFVAIVDDEDAERVRTYKWRVLLTRRSMYAVSTTTIGAKRVSVYMHRLVLGGKAGGVVDHINGDGLDNKKSNLRQCTIADNTRNKKSPVANNTSGYTGVCWHIRDNVWDVAIVIGGKKKYIGGFHDKEEAIAARRKAELQYYGEFAPA